MKIIGNQSSLSANLLFVAALLTSLPILAQTEPAKQPVADWDSNFFVSKCPGSLNPDVIVEDPATEIDIDADQIKRPSNGVISFSGNVKLQQGSKQLQASELQLNKSDETLEAQGDVHYQDQQLRVTADKIALDINQKTGELTNTRFQFVRGAMRGQASSLQIEEQGQLRISDVGITTCPPENESWLFLASDIQIDSVSGTGEAEDVSLRINDIPVFYFPWISFPTDDRRKSGFLYPSFGSSNRNGLELDIPWYWNIAPDKDATFNFRHLSKRGLMLGAEYRQLTAHSDNNIYAEYLPDDKRAINGNQDRFFYQVNSTYSQGDHWRGLLTLNAVSDDDYFYDFGGNYSSGNRNYLKRFGQISYRDEHLLFSGLFSHDQILNTPTDPYSRLPQLRLSLLYPESFAGLSTNLHMEATAFRRDNSVEAERLYLVPELSLPVHWQSGYIKPQFKLHHSRYSQDDPQQGLQSNISRTLPIFSIDSGMYFERDVNLSKKDFLQTLEPRLFYLYVPERQQDQIALFDTTGFNYGVDSLFRENRYSGFDRIGDSNQLSLAITSRFFEQSSGRERLSVSLGRAYYLEDRRVNYATSADGRSVLDLGVDTRANSALMTNVQFEINDHWWLKGELEYDRANHRTEKGVLGLQYLSSGLILNLRHRKIPYNGTDDIEQSEVSFSWQLSNELAFIGRWQQDLRKNRTIDSFAGLEYESCCWAIRLVARRYLNVRLDQQGFVVPDTDEFNRGIYLEFILKGLTNIGKGLDLESDVQGYEDRFKTY